MHKNHEVKIATTFWPISISVFISNYTSVGYVLGGIFSCHEVASSGTTNVCSVCVRVCPVLGHISQNAYISEYLCLFNSDIYETLNFGPKVLNIYSNLYDPGRLPLNGYFKTWGTLKLSINLSISVNSSQIFMKL